jgi:hypothetical protein
MNSAMDRVGLPAYGPDLVGADGGWGRLQEALDGLPYPLREVWLAAAARPASGAAILNIDRRRISIETKRALECLPGLDFRQGFVTDLRVVVPEPSEPLGERGGENAVEARAPEDAHEAATRRQQMNTVQVETIFGEIFDTQAVVVAAGLSLDASTLVGAATVQGGRYGEPSSEGLWTALRALGAEYRETTVEVGARVSARDAVAAGWLHTDADDGTLGARTERLVLLTGEGESASWPAGYPPAPHWDSSLRIECMVMGPGEGQSGEVGEEVPVLSPDGGATAELYVAAESALVADLTGGAGGVGPAEAEGSPVATRMPSTAAGKVLTGLSGSGRLTLNGWLGSVWVVGRSAGASDYAASLRSGVLAAADIAESFGLPAAPAGVAGTLPGHASGRLPGDPLGRPVGRPLGNPWALEVPGAGSNPCGAA